MRNWLAGIADERKGNKTKTYKRVNSLLCLCAVHENIVADHSIQSLDLSGRIKHTRRFERNKRENFDLQNDFQRYQPWKQRIQKHKKFPISVNLSFDLFGVIYFQSSKFLFFFQHDFIISIKNVIRWAHKRIASHKSKTTIIHWTTAAGWIFVLFVWNRRHSRIVRLLFVLFGNFRVYTIFGGFFSIKFMRNSVITLMIRNLTEIKLKENAYNQNFFIVFIYFKWKRKQRETNQVISIK